jgi:hypothetical protein
MAQPAVKSTGLKVLQGRVAWRIGVANLAVGIICTAALGVFKTSSAPGFALGFTVALFNIFWLMRVVRKGVALTSPKAARIVARSYFVRFAATALVLTLIVSKGVAHPLPLMLGLTVSIVTTICVMIFSALEEVSEDAP